MTGGQKGRVRPELGSKHATNGQTYIVLRCLKTLTHIQYTHILYCTKKNDPSTNLVNLWVG